MFFWHGIKVHYREIESNSVGYKTDIDMSSLDFEEFLWAKGYCDDLVVEEMLAAMCSMRPLKHVTHEVLRGLFLDYCTLGGMPDVVRLYVENKGCREC